MKSAKPKPPTIQQLVDIVREYNIAREHELRMMPTGGFPEGYKGTIYIQQLYDCAELATLHLKPALNLEPISPR